MSEFKNVESNSSVDEGQEIDEQLRAIAMDAMAREEKEWQLDYVELNKHQVSAEKWLVKSVTLSDGLQAKKSQCVNNLEKILEKYESYIIGLDENLKDLIKGRIEGLKLIVNKMLVRAAERSISIIENGNINSDMHREDLNYWFAVIAGEMDAEQSRKKIDSHLKQVGNNRYKVLTAWRDLAIKRRKDFLGFVEKQILPIADGIYDGKKYVISLEPPQAVRSDTVVVEGLIKEDVVIEERAAYNFLAGVYAFLDENISEILAEVGVSAIQVESGEAIDYERHEPFDVEVDTSLEDEHIKAVVRAGYEYVDIDTLKSQVLRAAQVIVVKN